MLKVVNNIGNENYKRLVDEKLQVFNKCSADLITQKKLDVGEKEENAETADKE
jgi:hypothetical protein